MRATPTRTRPPDIERLAQAFAAFHVDYTASRLPAALVARTRVFFADLAGDWALLALALAILGVAAGPAALRFAAGSAAGLFLVHLAYAHPPQWSIYYAEALPVGAAVVAAGAMVLLTWLAKRRLRRSARARCVAHDPRRAGRHLAAAGTAWRKRDSTSRSRASR